jgi:5'(3')-deoxyribonucleotidase
LLFRELEKNSRIITVLKILKNEYDIYIYPINTNKSRKKKIKRERESDQPIGKKMQRSCQEKK